MERSDIGRPGAAGDVTGAEHPSTIAALLAGRENNPAWNRAGPERSSERTAEAGMERSDIGRPGAAGDVTGAEPPSTIAALLAGRENNPGQEKQ